MPRSRRMSDRELRGFIANQLSQSDWFSNSEREKNHAAALDAYFGRDRPPAVTGRSNAMSMDVADSLEAITAQLMPAFAFDEIAMFEPENTNDVEQARLESNICNRYLKANNGKITIQGAVRNALLLRNGILKCFVDTRQNVDHERYTALSDLELQIIQQPTAENQAVRITRLVRNADDAELTDVNITRTSEWKRLTIENIDPANFISPREYTSIFLEDADIVGERKFMSRSKLRSMGFSREVVENLKATNSDHRTSSLARNRARSTPRIDSADRALDLIEVFELYVRVDVDRDGVAELRKILYAGSHSAGEILSSEIWPFQPYAAGTPFLLPNRFWGLSIYDKIIEIQNIKTGAVRQQIDNLQNSNWNELVVVDGEMNMPDAQARRPGGILRADVPNAITAVPIQDTGTSSRAFLSYMDQMRSERVGASLDMQSAQFQIAAESAHGAERVLSTKEQLAQLLCSTIGETMISELFRIMHRTLQEFMPTTAEFNVGPGRFVSATPGDWPARAEVTVVVGMSNAERREKRQTMDALILQQEKLHQAGFDGVLMNLETYHSALLDWSRAGGISSPRRYWLDPRQPEQQEALEQKAQQAEQQAEKQSALEERIFSTQVLIGDRDNASKLLEHMTQLRFSYWKEALESVTEEFRIQAQGSEDIRPDPAELEAAQAEGRRRANARA